MSVFLFRPLAWAMRNFSREVLCASIFNPMGPQQKNMKKSVTTFFFIALGAAVLGAGNHGVADPRHRFQVRLTRSLKLTMMGPTSVCGTAV
jgi:hypothetical protein